MVHPNILIGSKNGAKKQHDMAVERYYQNPVICKFCGKVVELCGQKPADVRQKKFCNSVCSAKFNNLNPNRKPRRKKAEIELALKCSLCGNRMKSRIAKICKQCHFKNMILSTGEKTIQDMIIENSSRHAYQKIRQHAHRVADRSNLRRECSVCGYETYTELCHKKSIGLFPRSAKLSEVNNISNLIYLCPNHHWEFDSGILII